jgi:5'-nucleotidase
VTDVRLVNGNGAVVDQIVDPLGGVPNPARTYRVTVNNFLATGGDGFSTLIGGSSPLGGAQDIDALAAYLAGFRSPAPAYDPNAAALHKPRITRLP